MQLAARHIDEALGDPPRGGTVLGVYRNACSWRCDDGTVTTLLSAANDPLPLAVTVETPEAFAFTDHATVGQFVRVRGGIVRFANGGLSIDLRWAERWCGRLDNDPIMVQPTMIDAGWEIVAAHGTASAGEFCLGHGKGGNPGSIALAGADSVSALVSSTKTLDHAHASGAALALVGRGHGLTPSGDDFLVGFLAGLSTNCGARPKYRQFVRALGLAIVADLGRTNSVSATYLRAAADGRVGAALHAVINAFRSGKHRAVATEIRRVLGIGHESGTCTIIGLLAGLECWPVADRIGR